MTKCVFLDRDGVINRDNPNYTYTVAAFEILPGVVEATRLLRQAGFRLIVITNQSGIAQGIYTEAQMHACHAYFQQVSNNSIDHFYFCPHHPSVTESLARKPGTLMFEKAMARFSTDIASSWMVGDRGRDLIPARKLGIKTIQIGDEVEVENKGDYQVNSLLEAARLIITN
ncbi:MAG: HAD family hydrolase [Cyclobacteriaceae bacterium]|nr:HAD family hydrolase [Cyclobacteriaceae bacterium]